MLGGTEVAMMSSNCAHFSPTRACLSLMSADVDSPHPDVLAELNMIESIGEVMKLGFSCLPVQGTNYCTNLLC